MSTTHSARMLALVFSLLPVAATALEVRCVSTVAQLEAAAELFDDAEVEIRIVTGTYDITGTCLTRIQACIQDEEPLFLYRMWFKGGYAPGCASRGSDPAATVLTASDGIISLRRWDSASNPFDTDWGAALSVSRLTLRAPKDGVYLYAEDELTLDQVWIDQSDSFFAVSEDSTIVMTNSLVTRTGNAGIRSGIFGQTGRLEGNTFARNPSTFYVGIESGVMRNNIIWPDSNPAFGAVRFEPSWQEDDTLDLSVRNNLWRSVSGLDTLANPPVSTLTADPQFVNAAALNFRLQASSPAISTAFPASSLLVQQDYTGGPRWFGEAPDRGAFESTIGTTAPLITVQNANDSGIGSLRQAILDANALPNVNRIEFDIGNSCGPQVIALNSPLPAITEPVVIDGYTQPGAARNTSPSASNALRCIAITGGGTVTNGISTASNDAASVTLDGLGFGGFSLIAVNLTGGNGHRFVGSQIGGQIGPAATPLTLAPSVNGLQVGSLFGSSAADGVEIGGEAAGERNVFSDVTDAAIRIGSGAEDARVVNNHIGVGPAGDLASEGNRDGIVINGRNTEVRGNTISNNTRHGVYLTGSNARANRIIDNRIGVEAFCNFGICSTTLGNTEDGVRLDNAANDNRIEANIISHNGDDGVAITGALRNAVLRNVITANTEQPIDLGDDGASANGNNSVPAPPAAGNLGQNRPLLSGAGGTIAAGAASGTLTSANGLYRIDFYSAIDCLLPVIPNSYGEPETWLGTTYVTISNGTATTDGSAAFSGLIGVGGDLAFFNPTRRIVATATRMAGSSPDSVPRGTSELSSCVTYAVELFKDGFE